MATSFNLLVLQIGCMKTSEDYATSNLFGLEAKLVNATIGIMIGITNGEISLSTR